MDTVPPERPLSLMPSSLLLVPHVSSPVYSPCPTSLPPVTESSISVYSPSAPSGASSDRLVESCPFVARVIATTSESLVETISSPCVSPPPQVARLSSPVSSPCISSPPLVTHSSSPISSPSSPSLFLREHSPPTSSSFFQRWFRVLVWSHVLSRRYPSSAPSPPLSPVGSIGPGINSVIVSTPLSSFTPSSLAESTSSGTQHGRASHHLSIPVVQPSGSPT